MGKNELTISKVMIKILRLFITTIAALIAVLLLINFIPFIKRLKTVFLIFRPPLINFVNFLVKLYHCILGTIYFTNLKTNCQRV